MASFEELQKRAWNKGYGVQTYRDGYIIMDERGSHGIISRPNNLKEVETTLARLPDNSKHSSWEAVKNLTAHDPAKSDAKALLLSMGGEVDEHLARELEIYSKNDEPLYRQGQAWAKNYMGKMKRGKYDHNLAVRGIAENYVNDVAAKYRKEFGDFGNVNKATKYAFAESWVNSFEAEAKLGNYDYLIEKKRTPEQVIADEKKYRKEHGIKTDDDMYLHLKGVR